MNRIDRLFAITTLLQSKGRVRAADLASTFEVSTRTIYRDVAALSEAGVPVVSLPGQGYSVTEGYFLPPLFFTAAEAGALSLAARLYVSQMAGPRAVDAERAIEKIAAILPAGVRQQVERQMAIIRIVLAPRQMDVDDARLSTVQQAILDRRVLSVRYHGRASGEITVRQVEPRALAYREGAWYLVGFCRLRGGERHFRIDRIDEMAPLDERFAPRQEVWHRGVPVVVRVRFDPTMARWAREQQHWSFAGEEETDNSVVMTYRPDNLAEIARWILAWGTATEVLSPPELRRLLRAEALAIADRLNDPPSS